MRVERVCGQIRLYQSLRAPEVSLCGGVRVNLQNGLDHFSDGFFLRECL